MAIVFRNSDLPAKDWGQGRIRERGKNKITTKKEEDRADQWSEGIRGGRR